MPISRSRPNWQAVASILYAELSRWGFGDFHYGETPRDPEVLAALAVVPDPASQAMLKAEIVRNLSGGTHSDTREDS